MDMLARWMVVVHHDWRLIVAFLAVGIAALLLAYSKRPGSARVILWIVSWVALTFIITTGLVIAPLDDWQHQHGGCLLESLQSEGKR